MATEEELITLVEYGTDVNVLNEKKETILFFTLRQGYVNLVTVLLSSKFENYLTNVGYTALALCKNLELRQLLGPRFYPTRPELYCFVEGDLRCDKCPVVLHSLLAWEQHHYLRHKHSNEGHPILYDEDKQLVWQILAFYGCSLQDFMNLFLTCTCTYSWLFTRPQIIIPHWRNLTHHGILAVCFFCGHVFNKTANFSNSCSFHYSRSCCPTSSRQGCVVRSHLEMKYFPTEKVEMSIIFPTFQPFSPDPDCLKMIYELKLLKKSASLVSSRFERIASHFIKMLVAVDFDPQGNFCLP
eukprot:TRINITY_DN2039_c0_g2_i7.p1 TRINITY_DN2039_c0_g2~~TRINITY_DN2039_c0_g2_i7.p1  ORF type:complete len:298 (-),score=65.70 TRINITY_DN2039_c0_g2_i7:171-1064(-)